MRIRPLNDRVIVKREEAQTISAGGIVIPGGAAEIPATGKVVAFGLGKTLDNGTVLKFDFAIGDKVLFGKNDGSAVKIDGEEFLVLREEDVMAVFEGE
jgi:chaperonin GroES